MSVDTQLANVTPLLKEYYAGSRLVDEMLKNNPFFGMVRKNTKLVGSDYPVPVALNAGGSASPTFSVALASQTAPTFATFKMVTGDEFDLATVDIKALRFATDDGAFADLLTTQLDMKLQALVNRISAKLFRPGNALGTISAVDTSTGVVTLTSNVDARFFTPGMVLEASATDSGVPVGGAASPINARVLKVGWIAGTVTLDTEGGSAAWIGQFTTTNKYLSPAGTYGAPKLLSVPIWNPDYAHRPVAGENFNGVDRTIAPEQLAGLYLDGRGMSPEEALIEAFAVANSLDARPDSLFVNPIKYGQIIKGLTARREILEPVEAGIGFSGVQMIAPYGPVNIFSDPNVALNSGHLLTLKDWELRSNGQAPGIEYLPDGGIYQRLESANAVQARIMSFAQIHCEAPKNQMHISFGEG